MAARHFVVSRAESGQTVVAVLRAHLGCSWPAARRLVQMRRVRLGGAPCLDPGLCVRRGQRVDVLDRPAPEKEAVRNQRGERARAAPKFAGPRPVVRFADEHVVVVDKPPGLTTMRHPDEAAEFGARAQRYLPPTLADLLDGRRVRPVHRLDKETSGLVVFARTVAAERHLGKQFRAHTVERTYLGLVRGRAVPGRIESFLVRDRGDGRRGSGSGREPGGGQRAVTHVRVVEELGDFTLVECRLGTGRTHQVRIHLGEAGTPLCGERVYDRPPHGRPPPDDSGAPRVALHAARLGFDHPASGERMAWTSPLPKDLAAVVDRLRRRARRRGPHPPGARG